MIEMTNTNRSCDADAGMRLKRSAAQRHAKLHAMLRRTGTQDIDRLLTEYEGCRDIVSSNKSYDTRAKRFLKALDSAGDAAEHRHLLRIAALCFIKRPQETSISAAETHLFSRIYNSPNMEEHDRKTLRCVARAFGSDDLTRETLPLFSRFGGE